MADNIDHNINTLEGKGTFHGMGIITASTAGTVKHSQLPPVKRQKLSKAKDVIQHKGVRIIPFVGSERSGITSVTYKPLLQLDFPYILPTNICLNLFWHATYFFKTAQASWSGYMQDVSKGDHPGKSDIVLMPIIDLDPRNETCLYSTLLFIIDQAKHGTFCITFDQPLWIKAVNIIKSKSLNVVSRLGGFHTLMSFLGSIGLLMKGSGLSDALETVYCSNAMFFVT